LPLAVVTPQRLRSPAAAVAERWSVEVIAGRTVSARALVVSCFAFAIRS
jgi:hypothetical protein